MLAPSSSVAPQVLSHICLGRTKPNPNPWTLTRDVDVRDNAARSEYHPSILMHLALSDFIAGFVFTSAAATSEISREAQKKHLQRCEAKPWTPQDYFQIHLPNYNSFRPYPHLRPWLTVLATIRQKIIKDTV
ncbi:uncharacterized protein Bfra_006549 [Botrytis fragariae]|uniref:Uncharacterized protein n=1 Tax=Botrytis fragariae TaxID=1964551 RepID=A0A8H6B4M1_9HELO|nr:uncharacterized protein Bfra_006549 [Botrytis fragariae]KAF5879341.1 hypothetical protein Bfra_006549 [Botrytis fragariae]